MNTPPTPQENFELKFRSIRTLWITMFLSIGGYFVFTLIVGRSEGNTPNDMLFLVFAGIAVSTTLISFPLKSALLKRAIDQQQPPLVQQAYIVAWALTEVAALLGVVAFFLNTNRYYYVLFIIGAVGMLLHYPRREQVINAFPRNPIV
jgi:hypothetical protein